MDVRITREPGRHLAVTRFEADLTRMDQLMGQAFGRVAAFLARSATTPLGPAMGCYEARPDGMTVSAGFEVAEPIAGDDVVVPLRLPARDVVTGEHVGPYDELPAAYSRLREAAEAAGRRVDESVMWEEYVTGPDRPPEETRTVVSWPLVD